MAADTQAAAEGLVHQQFAAAPLEVVDLASEEEDTEDDCLEDGNATDGTAAAVAGDDTEPPAEEVGPAAME